MYTSGWPKNQNRCCHRIGEPPPSGSKMWAPRCRSAKSMAAAAVSTGNAISTRMLVTSMFQVNTGMRNIVMPGARIVSTVATMFTPVSTPDSPVRTSAMIHRSPPSVGDRVISDSGA